MKVYISKYRNHWLSPYTILEFLARKQIDYDDPKVEKWADRLNPVCVFLQKVLDKIHPRVEYVKIDKWDTWSMDHTLALIVLPMLKQLKETKHGSPFVDLEDVPEHMRTITTDEYDYQQCFDFYHGDIEKQERHDKDLHDRWDWVMGEMIFAFESHFNNWDEKYHHGDITLDDLNNNVSHFDYKGYKKENDRIQNGFRLFGKYYSGLWD